jgi:putative aldouronate transport system permease protein
MAMPYAKAAPAASRPKRAGIRLLMKRVSRQRQLLVLILPFMAFIFVFNYMPIWGWIMAFQNYSTSKGLMRSPFAGLTNFQELFTDANFINAIKKTLLTSVLKISTGFISAILLAVMLNEVRRIGFKRTVQTISYLPYFVSWVVAVNIVYLALSPSDGIVNVLLLKTGIAKDPIPFMGKPNYFYGVVALSNVWKNVGWNAIIYLAAMTAIDPELYEAAAIDGERAGATNLDQGTAVLSESPADTDHAIDEKIGCERGFVEDGQLEAVIDL